MNIVNGAADRRNVTIVLMNEAREPVLRWHAENAWVNKIEGPSLKAAGNEVAMESVELVHEGLTIETVARDDARAMPHATSTPGVYYERDRCRRPRRRAAAHGHRGLRRHRAARAA